MSKFELPEPEGLLREITGIIYPGLWQRWYDGTDPDAKPHPLTTREKYNRSHVRLQAWDILKLVSKYRQEEIRGILQETEIKDWEHLLEAEMPEKVKKAVREKHA